MITKVPIPLSTQTEKGCEVSGITRVANRHRGVADWL